MSAECAGCGKPGNTCADCSHSNWYVSCGCDSHGDHGGCSKQCEMYGCKHPRGLVISGTLEESEKYSDEVPPRRLVAKAVAEARVEAKRKHRRKMLKLDRIELTLDTYEEV